MTIIDDRDLFDDEDMLDFEDPAHREEARQRMSATRPATVSAARILMYLQAASPILLPIVLLATGGGGGGESTTTNTTTTTTTLFAGTAAGETQRRGGGGGLIVVLFFLAVIVGLIVGAARLSKLTSSARTLALSVEALLLLGGVAMALRGLVPGMVLLASSVAVIALLLAPATKHAIAQAATADTSARFDVRNLPTLDR